MTRIILVDDHQVVRDGIKLLIETQENFLVVGEGDDGTSVMALLNEGIIPDIVITDMNMVGMDGVELVKYLRHYHPEVKVIFLSMVEDLFEIKQAVDAGAHGYLLKNVGYEEILFALNRVQQGGKYICGDIGFKLLQELGCRAPGVVDAASELIRLDISTREHEVLQLLADGYKTNDIADRLFISKRTVEGHRQKLLEKTSTNNYAHLIKFAIKSGLVD